MITAHRIRHLQQFVAARRLEAFRWGSHDCCQMAAAWVAMVTGRDVGGAWCGGYHDAAGALRLARDTFGATEAPDLFGCERWPELAGLPEVPALFAQRGDLVSVLHEVPEHGGPGAWAASAEQGEGSTARERAGLDPKTPIVSLALCLGDVAAVPGPVGLCYFAPEHWRRAWTVGGPDGDVARRVQA